MVKLGDFIKTDRIIKVTPEDTLPKALSRLKTSHDAGFVFDDNKFLGVINPYYSIIKSSYPGNTKVASCLYHPPHVRINDSIAKVAKYFIDTKVHYLPVFDFNERFVGIVSARHLIAASRTSPEFHIKIADVLRTKNKPLITVFDSDTVATALNTFKKEKVSKLIVVGSDLKLKGILSYYDLIAFLSTPKPSEHQGDRIGNKVSFYHYRVKNFAKSYVLTLSADRYLTEVIDLILDKRIGSIVVVDRERYPVGIITTKDILRFFVTSAAGKKIEVVAKNLSYQSRQTVGGFFNNLSLWVRKIPDVAFAKLFVKEEKNGGLFKVVLSLIPRRGSPKVIEREGHNLLSILRDVKKN